MTGWAERVPGHIARYTATERAGWDRDVAFTYFAEFTSVSDWDPSIVRSERTAGEPRTVGTRYEVEFEAAGRSFALDYEPVEVEAPERIVLRAESRLLTSVDTMSFADTGDGCEVTYDADITLKGPLKLIDPLFAIGFNRNGDKAREGLRRRLDAPAPARSA